MSSFKEQYQVKKGLVDQKIHEHLQNSQEMKDVPKRLKEAMSYSLLAGGKRLRPVLSLMAYDFVSDWMTGAGMEVVDRSDAILETALSLEMIHTYSLIHDDLPAMDDDDLRRGNPTCHIKFDEATAILAGDGLLNQVFEILSRLEIPKLEKLINLISTAAGPKGMIGGQMVDMVATGKKIDQSELENLHALKTGKLIRCSVLAPVVLMDAKPLFSTLSTYGEKIGLAFQVMDDVLEETTDSQTLGKSSDSDEVNDKSTFVKLMGVEAAHSYAENLVSEAKDCLEKFTTSKENSKKNLQEIANYITNRSK